MVPHQELRMRSRRSGPGRCKGSPALSTLKSASAQWLFCAVDSLNSSENLQVINGRHLEAIISFSDCFGMIAVVSLKDGAVSDESTSSRTGVRRLQDDVDLISGQNFDAFIPVGHLVLQEAYMQ
ncbi:hypothetical protein EYF80_004588 [Liparis tanakae]|uniref:Uncharacterized protein n=1 Tax=Liparis tanakae TaxID=230148 RepID=A0A4Z2J6F9_9TELE|nr:hypothetical protein EYF80_004588 [Liparis tanakae]